MTPYTQDMLTNREVLAVDQDALGKQAYPVVQEGPFEVWMKPMADGSTVVGLFNRSKEADKMTVNFSHIGVATEAAIRDLWLKKDLGRFKEKYSVQVPGHGVVLVRVKPN
jgi:alpha-galactosidase